MKRIGGTRRKTRSKFAKKLRNRGKLSLTKYFQEIEPGEKVYLKLEPSHHKGMYHPRFHGLSGVVKGKSGNCYKVIIKDQNKEKTLIVHPVHLQKVSK